MSAFSKFEQTMHDAGSWVVIFAKAPVAAVSNVYERMMGCVIEHDVAVKAQKKQWILPSGYLVGVRDSDWTVVLHRLGEWEQVDGASMASQLSASVVVFEGEGTSGTVQCFSYEIDGTEKRFQTPHDADCEDEEFHDGSLEPAERVESYHKYFQSLGIVPVLLTYNDAGAVLATPDDHQRISSVSRVRTAAGGDG